MNAKMAEITRLGRRDRITQTALLVAQTLAICVFCLSLGSLIADALSPASVSKTAILVALGSLLIATLTGYLAASIAATSKADLEATLRQMVIGHSLALGPARMSQAQTGAVVSMATDTVDRVANFRQSFLGTTFSAMLSPLVTLVVVAVAIDVPAALVLTAFLPLILATIYLFQKLFRNVSGESRKARTKLAAAFLEALQGLTTLVSLKAADRVGDRLAERGEKNRQATMKLLARNQLVILVTDAAFSLFAICASVLVAWWRLDEATISPGEAIALVLLSTQLCAPLAKMGSLFYVGMAGRAGQRQISKFVSIAVPDQNEAQAAQNSDPVRFESVDFSYAEKPVLKDLDLSVKQGQKVVLLGRSGSGKSTILSLTGGDLLPDQGSVSVAGIELTSKTQDQVREKSAVVNQKTWLFLGTLAQNLRVGNKNATEDEMWQALAQVGLDTWARSLPDGLDSQVGERGMAMSGGQAQRLSIARAILSGRKLLLLDEPTSQVDLNSEQIIMSAIDRLAEDHTIVLATHRPSSTKSADLIFNLEER